MSLKVTAVLELGSSGIRLLIANLDTRSGVFEVLENAVKATGLGSDVFLHGSVSIATINECVETLMEFQELLSAYGLNARHCHVIASSALREAVNRDTFIEIVLMRTGFQIRVLEDLEENHYMYLAVQHALKDEQRTLADENSIIIEIGGGSTEVLLLRQGQIETVHSFQLGTIRVAALVQSIENTPETLKRIIGDQILAIISRLNAELPLESVHNVIIMGSEARFLAGRAVSAFNETYWKLGVAEFTASSRSFAEMQESLLIQKYEIDASDAVFLRYGLLILSSFLENTGATQVFVPLYSMREGFLLSLVVNEKNLIQKELKKHILASVRNLGRKFCIDEVHANWVRKNTLKLFDELASIHHLSNRDRLLAEIAALLHDIGVFIRSGSHHKHSEYIINNSELFSISNDERTMIACIARYHRKGGPIAAHSNYMYLDKADRIRVLKIAALLRIADALDHNHNQSIKILACEKKHNNLVVVTDNPAELGLIRQDIEKKIDIFEYVYGYSVLVV